MCFFLSSNEVNIARGFYLSCLKYCWILWNFSSTVHPSKITKPAFGFLGYYYLGELDKISESTSSHYRYPTINGLQYLETSYIFSNAKCLLCHKMLQPAIYLKNVHYFIGLCESAAI